MTLSQVADYLKLAERTILRMVHQKKIPCAKVGNQWRFKRSMIDDWLLSQMSVIPRNDLALLVEQDADSMQISRLVAPEYVITDLTPGTKQEVLAQIVRPLADRGIIANTGEFLDGLIKREQSLSTAMKEGIALPHLRDPQQNPIPGPALIVGVCPEGTDFASPDGSNTYLFFILSTDSVTVHLRLMSKLLAMLRRESIIDELKTAETAEDVVSTLIRGDYIMTRAQWRDNA